jgi:hypothetical protein
MPADLPERQRDRLTAKQSKPPDLVVVQALGTFTCAACGRTDGDLLMMEDADPVCLTCADLDHLVFLPAGDAALTRRARQASRSPRWWCGSAGPASVTSAGDCS